MKLNKDELKRTLHSKGTILGMIVTKKSVRSNKILWYKTPLCRCPTCPSHHVWGERHPVYGACIFCFSVYERSLFPDVFTEWIKYSAIKRCDQDIITRLLEENIVLKRTEKTELILPEAIQVMLNKAKRISEGKKQ